MDEILPKYLKRYINNEENTVYKAYRPDGIKELLAILGNPQEDFYSIHIAGTNGKGSTAFYLERIFGYFGYKTGLFTSPHLKSLCERIRINGELISEADFLCHSRIAENAAEKIEDRELTFFDMATATAFLYFKAKAVDIAIIETGLGGRKDSTNVIVPLCSVITSVSLDHSALLGSTPKAIAKEKAGIIKEGVPLVTSNTSPEVIEVLEEECRIKNSKLFSLGKSFDIGPIKKTDFGFSWDYTLEPCSLNITDIKVNSPVVEQAENLACALTAAFLLRERYGRINPKEAPNALSDFTLPGRFQVLSVSPLVIYDPAHNPEAIQSLMQAAKGFADGNITAVIGFMADKDYRTMFSILQAGCKRIVYYMLDTARAYKPEADELSGIDIAYSKEELIAMLKKNLSKQAVFLFTGSFKLYTLAEEVAKLLADGT